MAQKTLLQIIQTVAAELNLPVPQGAVSATDQSVIKLVALARATCDDLLAEYDWQQLQRTYTFSSVDGVDSYSLPSDIERFINGTFYDRTSRWPLPGPISPNVWQSFKASQVSSPFESFRVYGDKLWLTPAPGSTTYTFAFEYVSNQYVKDGTTGVTKADFTQDSDVCLFDHRLLVYGVKLKFLASIGMDTAEALTSFNRAFEFAKGSDAPAPRLSLGPAASFPFLSTANYPDGSWS